ncbi:leucine-rich repeat-containing protein 56 isoform X1 [Phascolarctos cinereus]|nr:leucine-rich repeat-containing protein 56 isoform X2 [Phascolarctos cinereus]XP_020835081.1 leucine-rich repeat-containing protein 56 isoform X2 [Phascolarctos cinereus]XP_020835082.1 leucine-rich repeat-containing protein 56 isoform X2 [Phascolarctos cinereus]XP_020835083.1 leucine-rich repeat-containing protein 56 isoform X2 [Phascolarctos cinereus]
MDPPWDRSHRGRQAGAASVRVTDLSWHGLQNPRPLIKDNDSAEVLFEEYLSPSKLQALAQVEDLQQVTALEMCVDTREYSLGNFGAHLPNLSQLKLNNSLLASIRDLGTSLSHLQILWMLRCGLADLDGISSLHSLKELYMSYNNISDLSQICLLDQLEVLDLEGNNIENLEQVRYLGLCKKLHVLTLEGNLICLRPEPEAAEAPDYNYRAEVKKLIPHLQFLDDIPAGQTSLQATRKLNKDWLIVKESIKEANLDGSRFNFYAGLPRQRLNPNLRLSTSPLPPTPQPWPLPVGRLPWTMPLSSPGSPLPEAFLPEELAPDTSDSSDLTHGVSRVLCGNPIKGLQERRQKLCDHSGRTAPQPPALGFVRSPLKGPEEPSGGEEDLWAQFKAWREKRQQCSQISQVCSQEEEEEDSIVLNDQEEEEKAKGPLGSCPGSPSPAPDLSKVMSSSRQPAGPSYPLIPSSLKCPSPPPLSSPKGHSRLELRGRRMSLNLTISPLSSSEAGAHLGKRLAPRTPFRCLMALRSPGSQSQPEHRGVKPSVGSGLTKATFSPQGLRPAARVQSPASFVSYTPSPLEPAFSLLRHQAERSAPEGPSYRQPIIHSPAKAPEKMLLPAPAQPLTSSSGGSSTLHRLPSRPSLGPITTPPPTPPAQPQRNSKS